MDILEVFALFTVGFFIWLGIEEFNTRQEIKDMKGKSK